MARGGKRAGAGRPQTNTVIYYRRVQPEWVEILDGKIGQLKTSKEIINRNYYLTYALTNEKDEIYGIEQNRCINWELNDIERKHRFYWSEVYKEGNLCTIIRKGMLLVNPTPAELSDYFEKSKINLSD